MNALVSKTRRIVKPLVLATAIALAASQALAAGEAKNVIFFLGDGMGPVTVTASRIYKYGEAGKLTMETLPRTARIRTFALDAQTPDSAPTMSAYMTGVKMRNEVLSMDATTVSKAPSANTSVTPSVGNAVNNCAATGNGVAVSTLLEQAIAKGKASGVVTTARLTHATPAATYAHACHRDAEYEISRQAVPGGAGYNPALGTGVDVLLGGISYYWRPFNATTTPRGRPDGRDLVAELQAKGYTAVNDLLSFNAAPASGRLIGLFDQALAQGHMSYELDRDPAKEPSLSQMTSKAIDILSKNPNGYFLMVEGGRIDHALHETTAKKALQDTVAFDNAIKAAIEKAKLTDPTLANTLIVVTADHDHTLVLNGYAKRTGKTAAGNPGVLGVVKNYVTGAVEKDLDGAPYSIIGFGNGENRTQSSRAAMASLDETVTSANTYHQEAVIRTAAGNETHGGTDVFLGAIGKGSETFLGTIDNTKVFGLVKTAGGL